MIIVPGYGLAAAQAQHEAAKTVVAWAVEQRAGTLAVGAPRGTKPETPSATPKVEEPKKSTVPGDVPGKKDAPKENKPGE